MARKIRPNHIVIPVIAIFTSYAGGAITMAGMEWYRGITLPPWTPPGSVIGAVWAIIFTLSAVSALIVWNTSARDDRFYRIFGVFAVNVNLNVGWSLLFFGLHMMGAAIFEAAALAGSVVVLIVLIWPVSRLAALLLVPYAGWVSFATYLTYVIWRLN